MFFFFFSLTSLNINTQFFFIYCSFDTSKVTNMGHMFYKCSSLISLDLTNFCTSKAEAMDYMFAECSSLISLNLDNFDLSSMTYIDNIFDGCTNLKICIDGEKSISRHIPRENKNCDSKCFQNTEYKIIPEKYDCIDHCYNDDTYQYEYINICYINCPDNTKKSCIIEYSCVDIKTYCNDLFGNKCKIKEDIQTFIREEITKDSLDELIYLLLDNQRDNLIVEDNNIKYEITSTNDNNYNEYKNISSIKLGECEKNLRDKFGISEEESLIIFKKDTYKEGLLIPIVEYEIYDIKEKRRLDLSVCKESKIELLLPCNIDENKVYKYNSSSDYYNDICFSSTTEKGTDIILSDRRNEFIDNNMSLM